MPELYFGAIYINLVFSGVNNRSSCCIFRICSRPSSIFHEHAGLMMLPPYDVDGWVEQILEVLDKPEQFKPVRKGARTLMVERFGFYKCLPKLAEFYFSGTTTIDARSIQKHAEIRLVS